MNGLHTVDILSVDGCAKSLKNLLQGVHVHILVDDPIGDTSCIDPSLPPGGNGTPSNYFACLEKGKEGELQVQAVPVRSMSRPEPHFTCPDRVKSDRRVGEHSLIRELPARGGADRDTQSWIVGVRAIHRRIELIFSDQPHRGSIRRCAGEWQVERQTLPCLLSECLYQAPGRLHTRLPGQDGGAGTSRSFPDTREIPATVINLMRYLCSRAGAAVRS